MTFKPSEEFLNDDLKRLQNLAERIKETYDIWKNNNIKLGLSESGFKQRFNSESGLGGIKKQIQNIEFILNK